MLLNSTNHPYQEAKHTLKKERCTQWFLQGLRKDSLWLNTETDQEPRSLATPSKPPDFFTQNSPFKAVSPPQPQGDQLGYESYEVKRFGRQIRREERLCMHPVCSKANFISKHFVEMLQEEKP